MLFPNRDILDEVAAIEFPNPSRVMITHSSALFARGIDLGRPMGDIDLVIDHENREHLIRNLGWAATGQRKYYAEDLPDNIRYILSPDERVDAFSHDFLPMLYRATGLGRVYPDRLFAMHDPRYDQDEETGLYVASTTQVLASKQGSGRKKDEDDIRRYIQHEIFGY
jgi:hypothetical protein